MFQHGEARCNGVRLHYVRAGRGQPLLLLHGWPEFWLTWARVMERLAGRFELIAPDLRGFGTSDKPSPAPSTDAGPDVHAADMIALMDTLGIERAGLVSHDVGAFVAQVLGRAHGDRFNGLFFFNCPYPGTGARWAEPGHLKEIWYQSFHQMPFAASLVGASRETCATYIGHFLRHWAARPDAFDDVFETWIDNFMLPGNLQGGFNWYLSVNAGRIAAMRGQAPKLPPITVPTCVRWGDGDALFPLSWTDKLGETFANLDFAPFPGVGHYPHRESPDRAATLIAEFFTKRA